MKKPGLDDFLAAVRNSCEKENKDPELVRKVNELAKYLGVKSPCDEVKSAGKP